LAGNAHFDLENFVPYTVSTLSRQFASLLEDALKKQNLTLSNWRVLLCLTHYEKRTLNQIVDYTLLPQSTLSRALARMEERGLISRNKNDHDQRNYDIEITELGRDTITKSFKPVLSACAEPLSFLDENEKKAWMMTTKKIIAHLESL